MEVQRIDQAPQGLALKDEWHYSNYWEKPEENKMLTDLPKKLQQQIIVYLESNNFPAAKALRDAWIASQVMGESV